MTLTPFFRKLGLTVHITFSVGWFGAVAGFLALAIAGLTSQNSGLLWYAVNRARAIPMYTVGSVPLLLDSCQIAIDHCCYCRFIAPHAANWLYGRHGIGNDTVRY